MLYLGRRYLGELATCTYVGDYDGVVCQDSSEGVDILMRMPFGIHTPSMGDNMI
jgi:hypothetical protein